MITYRVVPDWVSRTTTKVVDRLDTFDQAEPAPLDGEWIVKPQMFYTSDTHAYIEVYVRGRYVTCVSVSEHQRNYGEIARDLFARMQHYANQNQPTTQKAQA